jgi:hypothetical protein
MTRFFKHVGETSGNKKVVIVQRSIPGESHMAAVIYSSIIPSKFHDDVMRLLESDEGQQSNEFRDILARRMASDGAGNLLNALAAEGYIKKVACNQVIVKPNTVSSIRLDELNNLLHKAGEGQEAIDRLEQLDRESGMRDSRKNPAGAQAHTPNVINPTAAPIPPLVAPPGGVLSDADIARHSMAQAKSMRSQAKQLVDEATRLEQEAITLVPEMAAVKGAKRGPKPKQQAAETSTFQPE